MDRDTRTIVCSNPPGGARRPGHTVLQAALVGLATLAAIGCVVLMIAAFKDGHAQDRGPAPVDVFTKLNLFQNWAKPELVIVLSGEMHGYIEPCGCTNPQYGGLMRRYNFFQLLWNKGWPTVAFDLGDVPYTEGGPQRLLKYRYSMMALEKMQYGAGSFGLLEMQLPLFDAMAETLNHPSPKILSANLDRDGQGAVYAATVGDWEVVKSKQREQAPKVGVVGIAGKTLENKDTTVQFKKDTPDILVKDLLAAKAKGADLFVVLYQGSVKDATKCATYCREQRQKNAMVPRIDIILCLADNQLAPAMPTIVGDTQIITVGHKGQYIGAMGVFRSNNPQKAFELKYQLVHLEPDFATPAGQERTNELNQLMEQYAKEVKDNNYLAKYKQVDHEYQINFPKAQYEGSAACQSCHPHAFKVWQNSKHFNAYTTLVNKKNPSLRQYDGECVKCHTTGFGYKTGFENENNPPPAVMDLKGVGCESCHGTASLHVAKPRDIQVREALNKWKFRGQGVQAAAAHQQRMNHIGDMCQKCHDIENDPKFNIATYWPQVEHMTPPPGAANPGPQVQRKN
jgi:hypothetical protein